MRSNRVSATPYYVSRPLTTGGPCNQRKLFRLPAPELERVVIERIQALLTDPALLSDAIGSTTVAADMQHRLSEDAATLAGSWPSLAHIRQREILIRLVSRIEVTASRIEIRFRSPFIAAFSDDLPSETGAVGNTTNDPVILACEVSLARIGQDKKLIMQGPGVSSQPPNPGLVRLLAQAHQMQRRLLRGERASIAAFAEQERMTGSYVTRLIRLAWLAPDIVQAILHGTQPPALTVVALMQRGPLPMAWPAQRTLLGFA